MKFSLAQWKDFKYVEVEKYTVPQKESYWIIPSSFAEPAIKASIPPDMQIIESVDLIYTKYCFNPNFDQNKLNKQRWENLLKVLPQLNSQTFYIKRLVAQRGCHDTVDCDKFFHGFVIKYRSLPTDEAREKEIAYIENAVFQKKAKTIDYELVQKWDDRTGFYYDTLFSQRKINHDVNFHTTNVITDLLNEIEKDNYLVVVDVTGSMYPYITEVIKWLKKHSKSRKTGLIVFFNDGDNMPSSLKRIGETKGIYTTENQDIIDVLRVMRKAMKKGKGGGESEENNVEAILYGLEECSKCERVLLIADNYETFRDEILLNEISKEIDIIVCGAEEVINPYYLHLQENYPYIKICNSVPANQKP